MSPSYIKKKITIGSHLLLVVDQRRTESGGSYDHGHGQKQTRETSHVGLIFGCWLVGLCSMIDCGDDCGIWSTASLGFIVPQTFGDVRVGSSV